MKFTVNIGSQQIILAAEQIEELTKLIRDAQVIETKYMGAGKGANGGDYLDTLKPFAMRTMMPLAALTDDDYDAMKFVTESLKGK